MLGKTERKRLDEQWECHKYKKYDIDSVLPDLASSDQYILSHAAKILGCIGDKRATEPLITLLMDDKSDDHNIQVNAVEALGKIGDPRAVKTLVIKLKHERQAVRFKAARALGNIGDVSSIKPLIRALKDFEEYDRREYLVAALECIDTGLAIDELVLTLRDDDELIRASAAQALGNIREPTHYDWNKRGDDMIFASDVFAYFTWFDEHGEEINAKGLRKVKEPRVINALISALNDRSEIVANNAAEALGEIGDPSAVKPLIEKLGDERIKQNAAKALGEIGDIRALRPLIVAYKESDRYSQLDFALQMFKVDQAVECFIEALDSDIIGLRSTAAYILWSIGDVRAVEPLITALYDGDEYLSIHAILALTHIGDRRAAKPISAFVSTGSISLRIQAIYALGELGDADCIEALTACLNDENEDIRWEAQGSIECIRDKKHNRTIK
jgi:HEAT repeat protein